MIQKLLLKFNQIVEIIVPIIVLHIDFDFAVLRWVFVSHGEPMDGDGELKTQRNLEEKLA
jgi:hypothetical protein